MADDLGCREEVAEGFACEAVRSCRRSSCVDPEAGHKTACRGRKTCPPAVARQSLDDCQEYGPGCHRSLGLWDMISCVTAEIVQVEAARHRSQL